MTTPGYFSFDELQWWARADVPRIDQLPWVEWWDASALQLRPLTFNLWLVLSWAFAATPVAMHLMFVMFGSFNATLLAICLNRLGATSIVAIAAALVFTLSPFAVYTHGWTATLADLLAVALSLSAFLLARLSCEYTDTVRRVALIAAVALLTVLALLAKESAVVLPALLIASCWRARSRVPALAACAVAGAVVTIYLLVRWDALTKIDQQAAAYAWSALNAPARALEYLLFPFMPGLFEIAPALAKSATRLVVAGLCLIAVAIAILRVSWRLCLAWLGLYLALLAPVLVLGISYNHYAYLASTVFVAVPALAWTRMPKVTSVVLATVALVSALHGVQVMIEMRTVGAIQNAFHENLVAVLSSAPNQPVSVGLESPADEWMLRRFLHDVPSYRGTSLASVSTVATSQSEATHIMLRDGRLQEVTAAERR
ncbi:MAG: hypothetical protein ABI650_06325 [Dokdonella sp.]